MNLTTASSRTPGASRQKVVDVLTSGAITDKSGRATSLLMEKTGYTGSLTGLTSLLSAMEKSGTITRELKGKRCFSISLTEQPAGTPRIVEKTPAIAPADRTMPTLTPTSSVEGLDVAAIAKSLLDQVIDLAAKPGRTDAELARLKNEYQQMQQRLFEATERSEKARQRIRLLEDELAAKGVEADGLRMRLRETEKNLDAIIKSPNGMRLDVERERELRELIRMMKAPSPNS